MRYLLAITLCAAPAWGQGSKSGPATSQRTMIPPPGADAVVATCWSGKVLPKSGPAPKAAVEVTLDSMSVSYYLGPTYPYNIGLRFDFAPILGGVSGTPKSFTVAAGTSTNPAQKKQTFPLAPGNYKLTIWGGGNGSKQYPVNVTACNLGPVKVTEKPDLEHK